MGFTVLQEGLHFWEKSGLDGPIWLKGKELGAKLECAAAWVSLAMVLAEVAEGAVVSCTVVCAAAAARAARAVAMMFLAFRTMAPEVRDQRSGTLGDLDICIVRRRWVILRKFWGSFLGASPQCRRRTDGKVSLFFET